MNRRTISRWMLALLLANPLIIMAMEQLPADQQEQPETNAEEDAQPADQQEEQEMRTCTLCFEDKPVHEFLELSCGHNRACIECLRGELDPVLNPAADLQEDMRDALRCPGRECRAAAADPYDGVRLLSPTDIHFIYNGDRVKFERFMEVVRLLDLRKKNVQNEAAFNLFLRENPDARHCPTEGCQWAYMIDQNQRPGNIRCNLCNHQFCSHCRGAHRLGQRCRQPGEIIQNNNNNLEQLSPQERANREWARQNIKACPACNRNIQRTEGCNYMRCQCGHEFCWMCLVPDPGHKHRLCQAADLERARQLYGDGAGVASNANDIFGLRYHLEPEPEPAVVQPARPVQDEPLLDFIRRMQNDARQLEEARAQGQLELEQAGQVDREAEPIRLADQQRAIPIVQPAPVNNGNQLTPEEIAYVERRFAQIEQRDERARQLSEDDTSSDDEPDDLARIRMIDSDGEDGQGGFRAELGRALEEALEQREEARLEGVNEARRIFGAQSPAREAADAQRLLELQQGIIFRDENHVREYEERIQRVEGARRWRAQQEEAREQAAREEELARLAAQELLIPVAQPEVREQVQPVADAQPAVQEAAVEPCTVCLDDEVPVADIRQLGCGHRFCAGCLGDRVDLGLREWQEIDRHIHCPRRECAYVMNDVDIRAITQNDDQVNRFNNILTDRFINANPNFRRCPTAGCEIIYEFERPARTIRCARGCHQAYCSDCRLAHPRGAACGQAHVPLQNNNNENERRQQEWIRANTRPCPNCRANIEKNNGCNHMTCRNCQHEFCWECLVRWRNRGDDEYPEFALNHAGYFNCRAPRLAQEAVDALRARPEPEPVQRPAVQAPVRPAQAPAVQPAQPVQVQQPEVQREPAHVLLGRQRDREQEEHLAAQRRARVAEERAFMEARFDAIQARWAERQARPEPEPAQRPAVQHAQPVPAQQPVVQPARPDIGGDDLTPEEIAAVVRQIEQRYQNNREQIRGPNPNGPNDPNPHGGPNGGRPHDPNLDDSIDDPNDPNLDEPIYDPNDPNLDEPIYDPNDPNLDEPIDEPNESNPHGGPNGGGPHDPNPHRGNGAPQFRVQPKQNNSPVIGVGLIVAAVGATAYGCYKLYNYLIESKPGTKEDLKTALADLHIEATRSAALAGYGVYTKRMIKTFYHKQIKAGSFAALAQEKMAMLTARVDALENACSNQRAIEEEYAVFMRCVSDLIVQANQPAPAVTSSYAKATEDRPASAPEVQVKQTIAKKPVVKKQLAKRLVHAKRETRKVK